MPTSSWPRWIRHGVASAIVGQLECQDPAAATVLVNPIAGRLAATCHPGVLITDPLVAGCGALWRRIRGGITGLTQLAATINVLSAGSRYPRRSSETTRVPATVGRVSADGMNDERPRSTRAAGQP
jgi:hypothetical protein